MSLQLKNLCIQRGNRRVLDNVSLDLEHGRLYAVLGANGAGKSSLVGALAGEIKPTHGTIHFDSSDLTSLSVKRQARIRAVLLQNSELQFPFNVKEVIAMGGYPFEEASAQQVDAWIAEALSFVDADQLIDRPYQQLSGGEQRRIQFARVLAQCLAMEQCEGRVYLFLDEPLANLDPKHQTRLMRTLQKLARERQFTILIVLHDVSLASYCDEILLIANQAVVAKGSPAAVLNPDNLRQVFDTEMIVLAHPQDQSKLVVLPASL